MIAIKILIHNTKYLILDKYFYFQLKRSYSFNMQYVRILSTNLKEHNKINRPDIYRNNLSKITEAKATYSTP